MVEERGEEGGHFEPPCLLISRALDRDVCQQRMHGQKGGTRTVTTPASVTCATNRR